MGDDNRKQEGPRAEPPPQDELVTHALPPDSSEAGPLSPGEEVEIARSKPQDAFGPDDIVAERYRVIRFVAKGGMGEVYEAEDLTLHGRVALKTIRPDTAANPISVERFKREISIARRITHPNVSRIYDVGVHRGPPQVMFLSMEFLEGETLSSWLSRTRRKTEAEALPIAEQIAAGLAAAHEVGIIHRDFKSANVMLVAAPGSRGLRAIITDFGLARLATSEEGMLTISEAGFVMGTPAYMAPEQVQGARLTHSADIYAFGIVLYEMVTGLRPFEADTPLSAAVKRLTELPVPPRQLVPTLGEAWNSTILRCLEREPHARFATALDVIDALKGHEPAATIVLTPSTPGPDGRAKTSHVRLWWAVATVAVAIAIFGVTMSPMSPMSRSTPSKPIESRPIAAVRMRRGVAVLGLRNNSGRSDGAWLSTAIAEMLSTELASGGKVRVAPGPDVARVKADLAVEDPQGASADTLKRIAKNLDVQSVVLGSYTLVGDPGSQLLRIDLRIVDAETSKVLASSATSGTETQLFDLVSRAGGGLRQKLGLGDLSPTEAVEVQASIPSNHEAVRLYTEGISRMRLLDANGARDLLIKAASTDPKHPLIRSTLSAAYSALGQDKQAVEEAERAVALSASLGREQKLQIEASFHEAAKQWEKAVDSEKSLWESFPDNLDYGLSLTNAQISAGKTREALVTIEALRKLPAPASADGRIDLVESRAHQEMGDYAKQRKFAAAAAAKGRAMGSRLLVARARMLEAIALLTLGDMQAMTAAVDEARPLFQAAGDRGGVARVLELTARAVDRQGDLEGEGKLLEQALAIHRELGDKTAVARVLLNIGNVLFAEGRPAEAQKPFNEALATFHQVGAKYPAAVALNQIGAMMFNLGDLAAAQKRYQEALSLFSELGEKAGTAVALTNIAEVLTFRGNIEEAKKMHEDALAINRAVGDKGSISYDLFRLGEIFEVRGELVAARERYQEALTLQTQIGDKLGAADTRIALAGLASQGQPIVAEKMAREAEEILRTEGAAQRSLLGLAVVADSLLAQGKQKEAYETAARAWKDAEHSEDRRIRYSVAISMARARAGSKKADDIEAALKSLQAAGAEAARSQFVIYDLEARLASGEIEVAAGRANGKKHLAALAKAAKSRGFNRIAQRAAAGTA